MQTNSAINTEEHSPTSNQGTSDLMTGVPNFLPQIKKKDGLVTGAASLEISGYRTRNSHYNRHSNNNSGINNMLKQIHKSKFDTNTTDQNFNPAIDTSSSKRNSTLEVVFKNKNNNT